MAKFSAERNMWSHFGSRFHFAENCEFEEYVTALIVFFERWAGEAGTGCVVKNIKKLMLNPTKEQLEEIKSKDCIDFYTWFIYRHGN